MINNSNSIYIKAHTYILWQNYYFTGSPCYIPLSLFEKPSTSGRLKLLPNGPGCFKFKMFLLSGFRLKLFPNVSWCFKCKMFLLSIFRLLASCSKVFFNSSFWSSNSSFGGPGYQKSLFTDVLYKPLYCLRFFQPVCIENTSVNSFKTNRTTEK